MGRIDLRDGHIPLHALPRQPRTSRRRCGPPTGSRGSTSPRTSLRSTCPTRAVARTERHRRASGLPSAAPWSCHALTHQAESRPLPRLRCLDQIRPNAARRRVRVPSRAPSGCQQSRRVWPPSSADARTDRSPPDRQRRDRRGSRPDSNATRQQRTNAVMARFFKT